MKAKPKTGKALIAVSALSVFLFLLAYIGIKLNIEGLRTEQINKKELLKKLNDDHRDYAAKIQPLEEEKRIDSLAVQHLQLMKDQRLITKITVSRARIDEVAQPAGEKH